MVRARVEFVGSVIWVGCVYWGMAMMTAEGLAYLTGDEAGVGGMIKVHPADFLVTEIPLFDLSGEGDHLYLYIEKEKRLTTDVARYLAQHFSKRREDVGYAGLKDKHAITRQWFSLEHVTEERAAAFEDSHIRILEMDRHGSKLKRGKLFGNAFEIKIRDVGLSELTRVKRMFDYLVEKGVPNFVGKQRFGYRKQNHLQGRDLLTDDYRGFLDRLLGKPLEDESPNSRIAREAYEAGDYAKSLEYWATVHRFERQAIGPLSRGARPAHAVNGVDKAHRHLTISAFQSSIFNRLLHERILAGKFDRLEKGDVAFKHDSRGLFEVQDAEVEQVRCDAKEISPSGPMWGHKMMEAAGEVGEMEKAVLAETGVTMEQMSSGRYKCEGARRSYRMLVSEPEVIGGSDEHGPYVQLNFVLTRGCYATTLLREIMKDVKEPVRMRHLGEVGGEVGVGE